MEPPELRPATPDDAPAVARIWYAGWQEAHLGHVPEALVHARTADSFSRRAADRVARLRQHQLRHPDEVSEGLNVLAQAVDCLTRLELRRVYDAGLARAEAAAAAAAADAGLLVEDFGMLRRPRVLVVDDSPTVRRQLGAALGQMGLDFESAESAQQALERLAIRRFELVLADVVMPDMDGYRLTRAIRKNRALRGLPVVLLTSRSSPFDLARGALAGCSSYLVKPVTLQSLRDTVLKHLRRVARRREDAMLACA